MGTMKGLSWAESIYQKFENLCNESEVVQISLSYVDSVGEGFRKILGDIACECDLINSSDACSVEPNSNLCSEHNVITEDRKELSTELGESVSYEKLSSSDQVESAVSYVEDPNLVSVDVSEGLSQQKRCGAHEKLNAIEAKGSYSSDRTGENYVNISNLSASPAALTRDLPLADEVCPSESHRNELVDGESMLSSFSPLKNTCGICILHEIVSLHLKKADEKQKLNNKSEASVESVRPPEVVAEASDGGGNRGALNSSLFYLNKERIELFEDVNHEDCLDDTNKFPIGLSHSNLKSTSFKKKLWRSLVSKVRPSKNHKRSEGFHHAVDTEMQNGEQNGEQIASASSSASGLDLCRKPTQNLCELGWEFL